MIQVNRARIHELVELLPEAELPIAARVLEALGGSVFANRGLSAAEVADQRVRLATFAEDWESPEMDAYDHYDDLSGDLPAR